MKKKSRFLLWSVFFFINLFGGKIHDLVQGGCIDELKYFLPDNCPLSLINEHDKDGKTALYYACKSGNMAMVKYLYSMGASLHIIHKGSSLNLLHIACMFYHEDIIRFLLNHGVSPMGRNSC